MKRDLLLSFVALLLFSTTGLAGTGDSYLVFDTHKPGTGKGATGDHIILRIGDPNFKVEGPGKCGNLFLGGFAFGHPDPRLKDPTAICGHGVVAIVTVGDTGRPPLSILPIEAPMPDEFAGEVTLDSAQLIRSFLPRLDRSEGDSQPVVMQMRKDVQLLDVVKASKAIPQRQSKR